MSERTAGLVCIGLGIVALGAQRGLWLGVVATIVCALGIVLVTFGTGIRT